MSIIITKSLQCDTCYRIENFGLVPPVTTKKLRLAAEKAGWFHSREFKDGAWSVPDTCRTCAANERRRSVSAS